MSGYKLADGTYSSEYKIGDKFEVVDVPSLSNHYQFDVGDVITFTENDGTATPYFEDEVGVSWERLKPYKESKQFTKADLRDGMICTSRCGYVYTVHGDRMVRDGGMYMSLEDIEDDLTVSAGHGDLDIIRVEQPTVLFTRVEVPVKSPAQIELDKLHEQIAALQEQVGDLQEQADKLQSCL